MIDAGEVRRTLAWVFRARGLEGSGSTWRLRGADLTWLVHLDRPPYGHRVAVELGLDLNALDGPVPTRAADCPIVLYAEDLMDRVELGRATHLDSELDDDSRLEIFGEWAERIADYVTARQTLQEIRGAHLSGEFARGFVRWDARRLLDEGP